jgi:hypothetical protein
MIRIPMVLVTLVSLAACGGAAPSDGTTTPERSATNGGDGPVLLRVRAPAGAHYTTETRVLTESNGVVVHTNGTGTLDVLRVDEAAGTTTFASAIGEMVLTDAGGTPLTGMGGVDLSGVVFSLTVDTRGGTIGEVGITGTNPANTAFAEQTRSTMSQVFTHLPEEPVGPGATWIDTMDVAIPVAAQNLSMRCELENRFVSIDETSGEPLAVIAVTGSCTMPSTPMATPGAATFAEIRSTSNGETRLALSDGLSRRVTTRSDMTVRVTDGSGTPLTELRMIQEMVTTTIRVGR